MGINQSAVVFANKDAVKQVVIVGASFGGRMIASGLQELNKENIQITFIDKSDHFEFICTNYKSLCDEDSFSFLSEPFVRSMQAFNQKSIKHETKFILGLLENIDSKNNKLFIKKVDNQKQDKIQEIDEIHYDVLIICTGAQYSSPWRDGFQDFSNFEERNIQYKDMRLKIQNLESILIVGGGATGVEAAAYIAEKYPQKRVGIIQRGNILIPTIKGAHEKIIDYVKNSLKIEIHTGKQFEGDETLKQMNYDISIDCSGYKFPGPKLFMKNELAECVDEISGQILVNKMCQVTNINPFQENQKEKEKTFENIYSFGDVCLTPSNEMKSIVSMVQYVDVVCHNIIQSCVGLYNFQSIPENFAVIQSIPLGQNMGLLAINSQLVFDKYQVKQKYEIEEKSMRELRNDSKALAEAKSKKNIFKIIFCLADSILCRYMSCGNPSLRQQKLEERKKVLKLREQFIKNKFNKL